MGEVDETLDKRSYGAASTTERATHDERSGCSTRACAQWLLIRRTACRLRPPCSIICAVSSLVGSDISGPGEGRFMRGTAAAGNRRKEQAAVMLERGLGVDSSQNTRNILAGFNTQIPRRENTVSKKFDPRLIPVKVLCLLAKTLKTSDLQGFLVIGETGFEPATARPPAGCATRLRHSPWQASGRRESNPF